MKSVNHRYFDLAVRIGRDYAQLEEVVRRMVQRSLARGRVEVSLFVEELEPTERTVRVNGALLRGYLRALEEVNLSSLADKRSHWTRS